MDNILVERFPLRNSLLKLRNRHFALIDVVLLLLTPAISLGLRVTLPWQQSYLIGLLVLTLLSLLIKLSTFYFFRLYSRYWRYASIDELISIAMAVIVAAFLSTGIFWSIQGLSLIPAGGFPRSVPLIDGLVTLFLVGGSRFSIRIIEYMHSRNPKLQSGKRVLIVGAGDAGEMVVREMLGSKFVKLYPIGFVDDDPHKIGSVIHGVQVLGPTSRIPVIVEEYQVDEVIIAIPTASGSMIRKIMSYCHAADIPSRTVPGIYEILNGRIGIERLRKLEIEDLLRRSPIQTDTTDIARMIKGKKVLITGAGGSIGSELCRQIIKFDPIQLILIGHGENSLFSLEMELTRLCDELKKSHLDIRVVVADVRNLERLETIFDRFSPNLVFHAAAHKHVPMMEGNPEEAVTNNVLGTRNIVNVSNNHNVERFVLISTDKAVNPVNIMGMSKRLAELFVSNIAKNTGKPFVSVRFGNVLGSRGSVVPIFQEQIQSGRPVTVTHPEVTRFFMTIPEAVQLVLQAAAMGQGGEVYVLDMGEPVKIVDLVKDMIELSGFQSGIDVEIVYTGLRPGEKIFEELFTKNEQPKRTNHEKIFVARSVDSESGSDIEVNIDKLIALAQNGDENGVREQLYKLINE